VKEHFNNTTNAKIIPALFLATRSNVAFGQIGENVMGGISAPK